MTPCTAATRYSETMLDNTIRFAMISGLARPQPTPDAPCRAKQLAADDNGGDHL